MKFDWYFQRRFTFLLLALLVLFVLHPLMQVVEIGTWLYDLLYSILVLAAFLLALRQQRYRVLTLLLGIPTLIANWTGYVLPGIPPLVLTLVFHGFAALFLGVTVAMILQATHEAKAVTTDSLAGAFSGYLLVATVFSHLYCIIDAVVPTAFSMQDDLKPYLAMPEHRRALLSYYSFITLTTVGYGDIVPAIPPARSLACMEALVGQFYIAVVMAELIGLKVSQPHGGEKPGG